MLKGIGTDIVEIKRMETALKSEAFIKKVFTDIESDYFNGYSQKAAGIFAAKEALVKAFGCGFKGISARDIEVLNDKGGKPYFTLYGTAKAFAESNGYYTIFLSISHERDYAVAFVAIEGNEVQ